MRQHETDTTAADEAEWAVLGAIVVRPAALDEIADWLAPEHFRRQHHRAIYAAALRLHLQGQPPDLVTLRDTLEASGELADVGMVALARLGDGVPKSTNVEHYARIVREKALIRSLRAELRRLAADAEAEGATGAALLEQAEAAIYRLSTTAVRTDWVSAEQLASELYPVIERLTEQHQPISGVPSGLSELDWMTRGWQPGDLIVLGARPSSGKAQPLDAPILMADGTWKPMGALAFGDDLASIDGEPSRVAGLYPQGEMDIFTVTFSDGRATECTADHLWRIYYRMWPEPRVITTSELAALLTRKRYQGRLWIECVSGEFGADRGLPLDPWLLGALIGNGDLAVGTVRFSTADAQTLHECARAVGDEYALHYAGQYDYRIVQAAGHRRPGHYGVTPNGIATALKSLGLAGRHSYDKFIPRCYLSASRAARLALLQGLMDTDGWNQNGGVAYSTSSPQLAQDVTTLVRSLGGSCKVAEKVPRYTYKGERKEGRTHYRCNMRFCAPQSLFRLYRKSRRAASHIGVRLTVSSVAFARRAPAQCIKVTHPSALYVTNDYIVTHNTALSLQFALHAAASVPVAMFSLEMGLDMLGLRALTAEARIDGFRLQHAQLRDEASLERLGRGLTTLSTRRLWLDESPRLSPVAMRSKLRRLVSTVGKLGLIIVDYVQLMDPLPEHRRENRTNQVAGISRALKILAREFATPLIALAQLNRELERAADKRPRLSDLKDSGSLEQDPDVVLLLHRPELSERDKTELEGLAELELAKHRNGPIGKVNLYFQKPQMRFEQRTA